MKSKTKGFLGNPTIIVAKQSFAQKLIDIIVAKQNFASEGIIVAKQSFA